MKAYHMTPSKNVDSILASGIVPDNRAGEKEFAYDDDRVYLWTELYDYAIDGTLAGMFYIKGFEAYTMLEINCDCLDTKLFNKDEDNPGNIAVYTAQAIPCEAIKSIGNALNFA